MSMTLRLTDDQDAALQALADAEGISKREAAVRAILERAERLGRREEVRRLTDDAVASYGPLLDRLAQ